MPSWSNIAQPFRTPRQMSGASWLALVAAMVIAAFATYNYGEAQDNDMWWIFATGREIVEHGIPYMNPFAAYGDQAIVIQQWLPCVIDYLVYNAFGFIGIGVLVFVLTLLLAFSVSALAKVVMNTDSWLVVGLCVGAVMLGCAISYLSIRPQVWSMIAFLWIINILERYRRGASWKVLIWLPVIMMMHANFHLSMMPYDIFIAACYLIPGFHRINISSARSDYRRLPLLVAILTMPLVACLNPYGIDGALYLVNSYSAASYGDYIMEMGATRATAYYGIVLVVFVIAGGAAIGKNGAKRIDVPLTLLFLVAVALSFQHVRNVWLGAVFAVPLILAAWGDFKIAFSSPFLRDSFAKELIGVFGVVLIFVSGFAVQTQPLLTEPSDSRTTPVAAVQWLDDKHDISERSDIRVFTHFNAGGFLEWHGYKVGMDARPELWNDKIAHNGQDRYNEYIDVSQNKISASEFIEGKDFEYLLVNTDTSLYTWLLGDTKYETATKGDGYVLFRNLALA